MTTYFSTLARSAVGSQETLIPFLNQLDQVEKETLEKEDKEYKLKAKENGKKGAIVGQLVLGFFSAIYFGYELKKGGISVRKFIEDFLIPTSYFYYCGYLFGEFLCKTSPSLHKNIEKRRQDRLDEKINKIREEIKNNSGEKEIEVSNTYLQLKKAESFFEGVKTKNKTKPYFSFWKK